MSAILEFYDKGLAAIKNGADIEDIVSAPARERIGRIKYVDEAQIEAEFKSAIEQLGAELEAATKHKD